MVADLTPTERARVVAFGLHDEDRLRETYIRGAVDAFEAENAIEVAAWPTVHAPLMARLDLVDVVGLAAVEVAERDRVVPLLQVLEGKGRDTIDRLEQLHRHRGWLTSEEFVERAEARASVAAFSAAVDIVQGVVL